MGRNWDDETEDKRPAPKPRKHEILWQAYLWWDEVMKLRQRHTLRISAVERGKSNFSADYERASLDLLNVDEHLEDFRKHMVEAGEAVAVWPWVTSIKGLGAGGLAAQLLAQIDDIGKFDTISKLWRFAGYAVIDGERERNRPGEKSHFSSRLKSTVYLVCDQFIRQQTPVYVDVYYDEKARQRRLHPVKVGKQFTDGHIHNRAMRKMGKIFLSHLWVKWREAEGLPVSAPYIEAMMGHEHILRAA